MERLLRLALAICAPLLLTSCLVTPGKFTSTLDIRADRSFTFAYQGEVIASDDEQTVDPGKGLGGDSGPADTHKTGLLIPTAAPAKPAPKPAPKGGSQADKNAAKMRELAETLSKEQGYHSVKYVGNNVFLIDYRISGRLDHGFIWPFNLDAELIIPFIAIELRGPDRVRIKAPGYANSNDSTSALGMPGLPGGGGGDAQKAAERLDGNFTLTTNAEVVSQNQEEGVANGPNGKSIHWRVTPKTSDAPMAVLKVNPLP